MTAAPRVNGMVSHAATLAPVDIYIPGYDPDRAYIRGRPAWQDRRMQRAIAPGYNDSVRMLTKFSSDGAIKQALFPVHGHDVEVNSRKNIGFFGSLEGQSYVTFDTRSLDMIAIGQPFNADWIGGGHGVFSGDGTALAVTERAPKIPYAGQPEQHFGRVTLRDPETLKIVGDFSTHGISPHEIRFLEDDKHVAIANYGSTIPANGKGYGVPRHIIEPSVTIVEVSSGKLVEKYIGNKDKELRHLCVKDAQTIFAIQTELGVVGEDQKYMRRSHAAYEDELTGGAGSSYLAAATVKTQPTTHRLKSLGSGKFRNLMRHGLSIEYDPRNDEVIASYPATHTVLIFDAESGAIKHHIDCAKIGLDYPCGITMLPDQNFYVIAGYWKNLFVFERGNHKLRRELSHYPITFGHSHITAA